MKILKKFIASSLITTSIIAFNPIMAHAEWKQDNIGWWYSDGSSYIKSQWKNIDGKWYYFDYSGYMAKNQIIDGYYIDSNGLCADGPKEVQAYQNMLKDTDSLKEKYNVSKVTETDIVDIDQDGTYEALVINGYSNDVSKTSIFTCKNGEIQYLGDIGDIIYYSKDKKALLGSKLFAGARTGSVYNLENGKLNVIHQFGIALLGNKEHYSIDSKDVTKEQMVNFLNQYGVTYTLQ